MNKAEVKKWALRRRASIPGATRIDVHRNGSRTETFDLTKDSEHDELASFVLSGDDLIAFGDDNVEIARASIDQVQTQSAGFRPSPEPVGISDRLLQTAIRESNAQATGIMAQVESMLEAANERHRQDRADWFDERDKLLRRIEEKDKQIEVEREKSKVDYEAQLRLRTAEHEQKLAEMKSQHEIMMMTKAFDKAAEIGDAIIDGIQKKKSVLTRLSAIWSKLPMSVHEAFANAISDDDKMFIANMLEEAEKMKEPKRKKLRGGDS